MDIIQKPSPNYGEGRKGFSPIAIFVHIECGTEEGTQSWFDDPNSQVSAHYSIGRDGKIYQHVKEEDEAWAVGIVNNPTWKYYSANVNPNYQTISIENEGYPADGFTDAQISSNIWLIADIAKRWNIRVDLDTAQDHQHVCGHYQLDSVNRKDCPSDKYTWDKVLKGVQAVLYGTNTTEDEEDMAIQDELNQVKAQLKQLQDAVLGFSDPTTPNWAVPYMEKAKETGFLIGDQTGNLMPNAVPTRAQLMVLFDRLGYFNWQEQDVSDWAKTSFDKMIQLGMIHGDGQGKMNPKLPLNKEQLAVILDQAGILDWVAEQKKEGK